jgi:RNA polymerase, sigma-24 subunit, ECF subfamily
VTAKEYLRQLKTLDCLIKAKLLEKERIRALSTKVTAGNKERVQGGSSGGIENAVIKMMELEEQINSDIDRLVNLKAEARLLIDELVDDKHKVVLSMYYVSDMTFEMISDETHYSVGAVHKFYRSALKEFEELYNSEKE